MAIGLATKYVQLNTDAAFIPLEATSLTRLGALSGLKCKTKLKHRSFFQGS